MLLNPTIRQIMDDAIQFNEISNVRILCLSILRRLMANISNAVSGGNSAYNDSASNGALGDSDPSPIAAALAQIYAPGALSLVLKKEEPIQIQAILLINELFSFGLLHPGMIAPYYIFLEATQQEELVVHTKESIKVLREKYPSFAHGRIREAIEYLYKYSYNNNQIENPWQSYYDYVRQKKALRLDFFRALASFLDWNGKGNVLQDKEYSRKIIKWICALVLYTEDEAYMLLEVLYSVFTGTGNTVLNVLRSSAQRKGAIEAGRVVVWICDGIGYIESRYGCSGVRGVEKATDRALVANERVGELVLKELDHMDVDMTIDRLEDILDDRNGSDEEYAESKKKKPNNKKKGKTKSKKKVVSSDEGF
jgi:hypothetical protein